MLLNETSFQSFNYLHYSTFLKVLNNRMFKPQQVGPDQQQPEQNGNSTHVDENGKRQIEISAVNIKNTNVQELWAHLPKIPSNKKA